MTDLVQGEFMQLGAKETENERFAHYLMKTYRKTASLMANSIKSVREKYFTPVIFVLQRNNLVLGSTFSWIRQRIIRNRFSIRQKYWFSISTC